MRQLQITILLILTLIQNVNSQDKVIKGDTAFWYKRNQEQIKELELTDFNKTQTDFAFRFWNYGQVVEIFKENNQVQGELTNYIFHSIKKHNETLTYKIKLDSVKSLKAYEIIQQSGILSLQTDKEINGWSQGCDGITYIIEHSDKFEYWYKNYWTPSVQDSIPESLIVMNFVNALSDTLELSETYKKFKESLPHRGCYSSGGMVRTCYVSNSYGLGYLGSTKLPIGFNSSIYLTYIGKTKTNFGLGFQYKFDRNGNYDFGFNASKSNLFLKNSKTHDFILYNYQKRKLDFVDSTSVNDNHQFRYGISIVNNLSISSGLAYMLDNKEKIGGVIGLSKWFNKPKINTTLISTIFEDDIDYTIGVSKSIYFNSRFFIRSTAIGLSFENYKDYNDFNINLTIWL